jgi:hypothetical protein
VHVDMWWATYGETIVTLIIGSAIGAFANWVFYRMSEAPKRFAWEFMSVRRLINAPENKRADLKVVYKGADVTNPIFTVMRIGNTGRKTITADDFESEVPTTINFGETPLLSADVVERSHRGVRAAIKVHAEKPNLVEIDPPFLKPGEWFEIQFVTDGEPKVPAVDSRFAYTSGPISRTLSRRKTLGRGIEIVHVLAAVDLGIVAARVTEAPAIAPAHFA